jgi:hypothetical protein
LPFMPRLQTGKSEAQVKATKLELAKALLDAGASPTEPDSGGSSALDLAKCDGTLLPDVMRLLCAD